MLISTAYALDENISSSRIVVGEKVHWTKEITATVNDESYTLDMKDIADAKVSVDGKNKKVIDDKIEGITKLKKGEKIKIEYDTPAPEIETKIKKDGKEIKISDSSESGYTNILAYTEIPFGTRKVEITHLENTTEKVQYYISGDKVYWTVPHLSEQNYNIIYITSADVLYSNLTLESSQYEAAKELDDITFIVPKDQYVRVTFEIMLNKNRDITMYGTGGSVQIYSDNFTLIAETWLNDIDYANKVMLTNMVGQSDTFYIKSLTGDITYDYIVDPSTYYLFQDDANTKIYNGIPWNNQNLVDANWTTYSSPESAGFAYYYLNYTKPSGALGARWGTSYYVSSDNSYHYRNNTIDAGCYNKYAGTISVRLRANNQGGNNYVVFECRNNTNQDSTGFAIIYITSGAEDTNKIIEDGMYWQLVNNPAYIANINASKRNPQDTEIKCNFTGIENDTGQNLVASITWFQNISGVVSQNNNFDYTTNITNNTLYSTTIGEGSLIPSGYSSGDSYRCQVNLTDGVDLSSPINSSWINSSFYYYNISIVGFNTWNTSRINLLNATISNSSGSFKYGTTNGNLTFTYNCNDSNMTIYSTSNYMNNYSLTSSGCNLDYLYNYSFYEAITRINVINSGSGDYLAGATIRINDSTITNTTLSTTGYVDFLVNNGTYTINVSSSLAQNSLQNNTIIFILNKTNTSYNYILNPKYNITLYNEITGAVFNISDNSTTNYTIQVTVQCQNKTISQNVTTPSFILTGVDCQYDYYTITLTTANNVTGYFRTNKPNSSTQNQSLYMGDLKISTMLQYIYQLNDISNTYVKGSLILYTYVNGNRVKVIEQNWALDATVELWIIKNQQYDVCLVDNSGVETCLPSKLLATASKSSTIVVPGVGYIYNANYVGQYYSFYPNRESGTVILNYTDVSGLGVTSLVWTIYKNNMTSGELAFTQTSVNFSNLTLTASGLTPSSDYVSNLYIISKDPGIGTKNLTQPIWYGVSATLGGFEDWQDDIFCFIAVVVPLLIIFIASVGNSNWIMALALMMMSIFKFAGWYKLIDAPSLIGLSYITVLIMLFAVFTGINAFLSRDK